MTAFKKVLVGIDGSEESLHAFEETVKLAKKKNIQVFVVSVAPSYQGDLSLVGLGVSLQEFGKTYREALQKAQEIAQKNDLLVHPLYEEGEPYDKIIDIAGELSVDLIVMGKKGMTALQEILMGSVTERVIGYSDVDVLVVPKQGKIQLDRVVVAIDTSKYAEKVCSRALEIAKDFKSEINIVSTVEVSPAVFAIKPEIFDVQVEKTKQYLKEFEIKFQKENIPTKIFIEEGEAYEKILETANKIKAQMIILGTHGRTGLRRLLMGSTCQRVIGLSKVPVLVVK